MSVQMLPFEWNGQTFPADVLAVLPICPEPSESLLSVSFWAVGSKDQAVTVKAALWPAFLQAHDDRTLIITDASCLRIGNELSDGELVILARIVDAGKLIDLRLLDAEVRMGAKCSYAAEANIDSVLSQLSGSAVPNLATVCGDLLPSEVRDASTASSTAFDELRRFLKAVLDTYDALCNELSQQRREASDSFQNAPWLQSPNGHLFQVASCLAFPKPPASLRLVTERLDCARDQWEREQDSLIAQLAKDKEWQMLAFKNGAPQRDANGNLKINLSRLRVYLRKRSQLLADRWGVPLLTLEDERGETVVDTDLWWVAALFDSMLANWIRIEALQQCLHLTRQADVTVAVRQHLPRLRYKLKTTTIQELINLRLLRDPADAETFLLTLPDIELRALAAVWAKVYSRGPLAEAFCAGQQPDSCLDSSIRELLQGEEAVTVKRNASAITKLLVSACNYGIGLQTIATQLKDRYLVRSELANQLVRRAEEIFPEFTWCQRNFVTRLAVNLRTDEENIRRHLEDLGESTVRRAIDSSTHHESLQRLADIGKAWRWLNTFRPDGSFDWSRLVERVSSDGTFRWRRRGLPSHWTAPHLDHADDLLKFICYQLLLNGYEAIAAVNNSIIVRCRQFRRDHHEVIRSAVNIAATKFLEEIPLPVDIEPYL